MGARKFLLSSACLMLLLVHYQQLHAQKSRLDSLFMNRDPDKVLDSLLEDFDDYLDSVLKPKSFFNVSVGVGTGVYSFEDKNSVYLNTEKKFVFLPSAGYYNKLGFGLSAMAFAMKDADKINFYQYAITPSYDVIKRKYSTGFAYTRYIQKDSLSFYTTPVQNELFAYYSYKNFIVRPTIGVAYGWGTKETFEKRKMRILKKRSKRSRNYFVTEHTRESVSDLSVVLSVRKDFNFHSVLFTDDLISLSPVLAVNSGTENYGLNTTYTLLLPSSLKGAVLPQNSSLSDKAGFTVQSFAMTLRASYLKGKFILQPQVFFDYYIPGNSESFSTAFSIVAGMNF